MENKNIDNEIEILTLDDVEVKEEKKIDKEEKSSKKVKKLLHRFLF